MTPRRLSVLNPLALPAAITIAVVLATGVCAFATDAITAAASLALPPSTAARPGPAATPAPADSPPLITVSPPRSPMLGAGADLLPNGSPTAPGTPGGAGVGAGRSGHAWVVLPLLPTGAAPLGPDDAKAALLHLPPRDGVLVGPPPADPNSTSAQQRLGIAPPGTVRPVVRLLTQPEFLAAWDSRVYLSFPAVGGGSLRRRPVASVSAVANAAGAWSFEPPASTRAESPLPGDGQLLALAATPAGLVALLSGSDDPPPGSAPANNRPPNTGPASADAPPSSPPAAFSEHFSSFRLLLNVRGEWTALPPPSSLRDNTPSLGPVRWATVVGGRDGLTLLVRHDRSDRVDVYTARPSDPYRLGPPSPRWVTDAADSVIWDDGFSAPGPTLRLPDRLVHQPGAPAIGPERWTVLNVDGQLSVITQPPATTQPHASATANSEPPPLILWRFVDNRPEPVAQIPIPGVTPAPASSAASALISHASRVDWTVLGLSGPARALLVRAVPLEPPAGSKAPADSRTAASSAPASSARRLFFHEVSLSSGMVFADGPALRDGLITFRDLQILALALLGIAVAALVFILRGDVRRELPLPAGTELAGWGRRLSATLVDAVPAIIGAAIIHGTPPAQFLTLDIILDPAASLAPLFSAVFLAVLLGTLGDWRNGRTIGKSIFGLGVVGYSRAPISSTSPQLDSTNPDQRDPAAPPTSLDVDLDSTLDAADHETIGSWRLARPTFLQALARNALKWTMPPLVVTALFDASRRHPGDLLARTSVVQAQSDAPPAADNDD